MKFRNISPLGDLSVPALGREVKVGDEFEATGPVAESLLEQVEHFLRIDKPKTKTAEEQP